MSERSLNPEERQKMNEAKQVEIKNFISAKALEADSDEDALDPHMEARRGRRTKG